MTQYQLSPILKRASLHDYQKLFANAYGKSKKLTTEYLRWLYLQNPHGRALGYDAFFGDTLAAHYVTVPRIYRADSERLPVLLSINTATHTNHQRRGLFSQLAKATYEEATTAGFQHIIGIANANSISGFLERLQFRHLGQVRLALCSEPNKPNYDHASLQVDKEWVNWRLKNPAGRYFITRARDGQAIINARVGLTVFSLGRVANNLIDRDGVYRWHVMRKITSLTPVFPITKSRFLLPTRLSPSPWHVIVKQLTQQHSQLTKIHFDGLSMDTF